VNVQRKLTIVTRKKSGSRFESTLVKSINLSIKTARGLHEGVLNGCETVIA